MWRKFLRILLNIYLFLGIAGGILVIIGTLLAAGNENVLLGLVAALLEGALVFFVVLLIGSGLGLILELADNVAVISENSEKIKLALETKRALKNEMNTEDTGVKFQSGAASESEKPKKSAEDTWICKCGKENPLKNNFCIECGARRPQDFKVDV